MTVTCECKVNVSGRALHRTAHLSPAQHRSRVIEGNSGLLSPAFISTLQQYRFQRGWGTIVVVGLRFLSEPLLLTWVVRSGSGSEMVLSGEVVVPLLMLRLRWRSGCLCHTCVLLGLLVLLPMSLSGLPAGRATYSGTSKSVCSLGCLACRPSSRLGMAFPFC